MMIELPKFNPEMIDRRDVAALAEEAGLRNPEDGSGYRGEWGALASLVLLCWRIADKHFAIPPKDKEAMHVIEGKIQELERSAGELASDADGYVTEAAVDIGFHMVNDDGNVYLTNDAQILELVRRVRSKPLEDIEKLTAQNTRLKEALEFYADSKNWQSPSTGFVLQYDPAPSPVQAVGRYKFAQDALRAALSEGVPLDAEQRPYLNFYPSHQIEDNSVFDFFVTTHRTKAEADGEHLSCTRRFNERSYVAPFHNSTREGERQ